MFDDCPIPSSFFLAWSGRNASQRAVIVPVMELTRQLMVSDTLSIIPPQRDDHQGAQRMLMHQQIRRVYTAKKTLPGAISGTVSMLMNNLRYMVIYQIS